MRGANRTVLEYGCGPGSAAFQLAREGARVTGIDLSEVAIEQARERARREGVSNTTFRVMDAEHLEFPDNTFDLIAGSAIIHHLDTDRALSEVSRTLKPGGSPVFMEPMGHNPLINLYRSLTPAIRTVDEHPLLTEDFETARKYFGHVECHYFHLTSLAAVPLRRLPIFRPALGVLDLLDAALFRWIPPARKYAWFVILVLAARKKKID